MSSNIISRDTESMRNWSNAMNANAENYDALVHELYSLIDQFAGSSDFSGGLSRDFLDRMSSLKPDFQKYSTTFEECSKVIKDTSIRMDNTDAELVSRIASNNPFNG